MELRGWFFGVRSSAVSGLNLLGESLFSESWQAETRGRRAGVQPLGWPRHLAQQAAPSGGALCCPWLLLRPVAHLRMSVLSGGLENPSAPEVHVPWGPAPLPHSRPADARLGKELPRAPS